jgi:hypothetical protein
MQGAKRLLRAGKNIQPSQRYITQIPAGVLGVDVRILEREQDEHE